MQLLPTGVMPALTLILILVGTVYIFASRTPKAYSLGILIMVVFFIQNFAPADLFAPLAFRTDPFLRGDAWWTPLTYMYLHAGLFHLVGNMVILVTAGPALEDKVGARWFAIIYFAAGFAAVAAHIGMTFLGLVPNVGAVGASGAIFGVLTAFAVRYPREQLPMLLGFFILRLPAFLVLLIHLGINLALMLSVTTVAWWGHFAGYFVGFAGALFFEKKGITAVPGPRLLPDVERLRPLAVTPKLREILDRMAQFQGTDDHDAAFAEAWVERFFNHATCPHDGTKLARDGFAASCPNGDYTVEFGRKPSRG